jgi:alginate O-acetyltransferase complex protein AlgJ
VQVTQLGDIAQMLRLPDGHSLFQPETIATRQILTETGEFWRPNRSADVLLLGDSFANIFSLPGLTWGESAGLAEQLSFELRRPLDTLLRNDNGSWATRQMLSDELTRGRDRLSGKRVVVWQFAMRELVSGDWKPVTLNLRDPVESNLLTLSEGESLQVTGVIRDISAIPKPGRVPYRDHIATDHLVDLEGEKAMQHGHPEAVVYVWSMRDNHWTDAAAWRPGQTVTLRLRPWSVMEPRLDGINGSELDDDELLLVEPLWGEMP